jgi:squalene synthase HpnC
VAPFFLPRAWRTDLMAVYGFARLVDDIGDGDLAPGGADARLLGVSPQEAEDRLVLLDAFEADLHRVFGSTPRHPLLRRLQPTVRRCSLTPEPFLGLIAANRQDQLVLRYETYDDLLAYCELSANPVGRLVLYLCGYRDEQRQRLSDRTCTALQLANFWQDVRRDLLDRDRIYIPAEDLARFDLTEEHLRVGIATDQCPTSYRHLIRFEVERTDKFFDDGAGLLPMLEPGVRRHVGLFSKGGRAIQEAVRRQGYDTLTVRPRLSKWQKGRLVLATVAGTLTATLTTGLGLGRGSAAPRAGNGSRAERGWEFE